MTIGPQHIRALIRVDYNVPILNGKILDLNRIESSIPTIKYCLKKKMQVVLMAHLGRPKNQESKFSLKILLKPLERLLGQKVRFISNLKEHQSISFNSKSTTSQISILENLRFHEGEKENNMKFAKQLSNYGDIYINDAFGVSHRSHASISNIQSFFKKKKYKGFLLEKELKELGKIKKSPQHPYTIIVGGSKIGSKIHLLKTFLNKADNILIGGGMAFPFIKFLGGEIGASICRSEELEVAQMFLAKAQKSSTKIVLPIDCVVTRNIKLKKNIKEISIMNIPPNHMGVDIGEKTIKLFNAIIEESKSIMWNGPMGVSEIKQFSNGTRLIGNAIARSTELGAYSLIGGGDTISDVNRLGLKNQFTYVSTGGGAMLEFFKAGQLSTVEKLKSINRFD